MWVHRGIRSSSEMRFSSKAGCGIGSRSFSLVPISIILLFTLSALFSLFMPSDAGCQEPDKESGSTMENGLRNCYWGKIPVRTDSTTAVLSQRSLPVWEKSLLVPYTIVIAPLYLLTKTAQGTVIFVSDFDVINRFKKYFLPRIGPFEFGMAFQAGGNSKFGAGLNVETYNPQTLDHQMKLSWLSTLDKCHRVTLGVRLFQKTNIPIEFGGGYRIRHNARFFGLGYDSPDTSKSYYTQETSWIGASSKQNLVKGLFVEEILIYSNIGARAPKEGLRAVDGMFSPAPPGYGSHSNGFSFCLALNHDTTAETGRPESGGVRKLKVSYFHDIDEKVRFTSYRGDLQQFLPLWFTKRALAARTFLSWMDNSGDEEIPFQRLLTNDDPDLFRGYNRFRWRDMGITGLSFEYRWPLWASQTIDSPGLDAYLLYDLGQVFDEFDEIGWEHMTQSYGTGIRYINSRGFDACFEIAFSEEETTFRLFADQIYQFSKGGLFNGREQVAIR